MMDMRKNNLNRKTDNLETVPEKTMKIRKDSSRSWLTLFYSLPRELVEKRPAYLKLSRCPYEVLWKELCLTTSALMRKRS